MTLRRTYPIGAEIFKSGVHFRVWAPDHKKVTLILEEGQKVIQKLPMKREKNGYFSLLTNKACEGTLYRYQLSNSSTFFSDPASRYQPQGPMGPSMVISPEFPWTDKQWKGVSAKGHVAYEMHIGTFTQEGTFESAMKELPRLASLGITLLEILPLNDFPGHFGWGYDGVNLFAPCRLYGTPNDLKRFIDKAHRLKLGVVLDVVYNHLGPEGNHMTAFAKDYLSEKFTTDWGKAINFDHPESRAFFLTNAEYWISEYHFDGVRVDATQAFYCSTKEHILKDITKAVKKGGGKRKTISIGENEPQETKLLQSYEEGGYGFDMLWNDDFHHTAQVRLTGNREAYYTDYLGSPQEFISALKYGFLYQGQYYKWQKNPRGKADLNIPFHAMMTFLENHDQVANLGHGKRMHSLSHPGNFRAMTSLMLLSPNTPLIFQGQEFNSSQPFYYFADHSTDLSPIVKKGRKKELSQFPRLSTSEVQKKLPDPENPMTFIQSKLQPKDIENNLKTQNLFKDLIRLRKEDPVFKKMQDLKIDGSTINQDAFLIRYFGKEAGDRLIFINFGPDYDFYPAPDPLTAPPRDQQFEVLWTSESASYGGAGTPPFSTPYWKVLAHSAVVLRTVPKGKRKRSL